MGEGLWSLISLQETDLKIMDLNRKIAEIPRQLTQLDEQLASYDAAVARNKEKLGETQKERRRLEGEVELLCLRSSKYKDQLMAVKKNDEYTAVLKEIETCKIEIARAEDRILEYMEFCDALEKETKAKEGELRIARGQIKQSKEDLDQLSIELQAELSRLNEQRSAFVGHIGRELLATYHSIANQRRGVALAEAKNESCQACHVRLRPQVFSDVRLNNQIIMCESCMRILYWKGDVPAEVRTDA
ncbi:MAG: hypothetical protein HYR55_01265 [Acidobacteria bacterium]|nr:hypothetical protein [Acidobacteriota bacterium]MBI3655262.1 hypothetical protein [Acidobacteriota bacterium]